MHFYSFTVSNFHPQKVFKVRFLMICSIFLQMMNGLKMHRQCTGATWFKRKVPNRGTGVLLGALIFYAPTWNFPNLF